MRLTFLVSTLAVAAANQQTLDCPLRQVGLDYAMTLQPWRSTAVFQEVADGLNGAQEAQNCSVGPSSSLLSTLGSSSKSLLRGSSSSGVPSLPSTATDNLHTPLGLNNANQRMLAFPLPTHGRIVYADPFTGHDSTGDGSITSPVRSLAQALSIIRSERITQGITDFARAEPATVVLRSGTFYQSTPLRLTHQDSMVTFQAYPHEEVFISGGVPLTGVTWNTVTPPPRNLWEFRFGTLASGFDAMPPGNYTIAQAQQMCAATPTCAAFTYNNVSPDPSEAVEVSFKYEVFWSNGGGASTYVKNYGYLPNAANLYSADVSGLELDSAITSLRVANTRAIRARYPNVKTVEQLDAMQIDADGWTAQPFPPTANYTFNPATPLRNDTTDNFFQTFRIGIGGYCSMRFTPQASYWCSDNSQGGGPGPYEAPVGVTFSNKGTSLPHTPYVSDVTGALVHSWRAGRWFSWVFSVSNSSFNPSTNQTTLGFSLEVGGNQGSRGGNAGQEFFIENIFEELDAPGEFFYNASTKTLYLWYNTTGGVVPPNDGSIIAAQSTVLINATGNQSQPIVGVGFLGLGFRDTAPNYLGPHGTPSGGDWAVGRSGALFFEGTVGTLVQGCLLTYLDGNAIFVSGYGRNVTIAQNEISWIGETAIAQWGYTDGSPVPGMGFDATAGNQPRGTKVIQNYVHEVGIYTKQNSFYFQSESFLNIVAQNIAFNGPRAGINFDDGLGGNSLVTQNVLFNFCRESSDHAPFNSWNRQVYIYDDVNGQPTVQKLNDTISYNFIIGNYHSSMCVDNDDGSSFYDTHHNVLMAASQDAAYGGNSLKSDFGGHSNFHHDNLDLFWSKGFGICSQLQGYEDGYYNNYLWLTNDGNYGSGQTCSGAGQTIVGGNTIWSPNGNIQECGMSLAQWQAKGNDAGTTAAAYPSDATVLSVARTMLGLPAVSN